MGANIVYLAREGEDNEELRYSLRSLKNLKVDNVWVFGYCPSWVQNVIKVRVRLRSRQKWERMWELFRVVAEKASDRFVLFNDDFFVLKPTRIKNQTDGMLADLLATSPCRGTREPSPYGYSIIQTLEILGGGRNFETHTPMWMEREKLKALCNQYSVGQVRSLYGNLYKASFVDKPDVKLRYEQELPDIELVSTTDFSFRNGLGRQIKRKFPERSIFEHG